MFNKDCEMSNISYEMIVGYSEGESKSIALLNELFGVKRSKDIVDVYEYTKSINDKIDLLRLLVKMEEKGDVFLLDLLASSYEISEQVNKLLVRIGQQCMPFIIRNVDNQGFKAGRSIVGLVSIFNSKGELTTGVLDVICRKYQTDLNTPNYISDYSDVLSSLSFNSAFYVVENRKLNDFYCATPAAICSLVKLYRFGKFKYNSRGPEIQDGREALQALRDIVSDTGSSEWLRCAAAGALGVFRNKESVNVFLEILLDETVCDSLRGSVAYALGQIGDSRAIPALIKVSDEIKKGLGSTYSVGHPSFGRNLFDGFLLALGAFKDNNTFEIFIRLLKDKNSTSHQLEMASGIIGLFVNQKALPVLEQIINRRGSSNRTVAAAICSVGNIGAPWSAEIVREFIDHESADIRNEAVTSLGKLITPSDSAFSDDIRILFEWADGGSCHDDMAEVSTRAIELVSNRFSDGLSDSLFEEILTRSLPVSETIENYFQGAGSRVTAWLLKRIDANYPLEARLLALDFLKYSGSVEILSEIASFKSDGCEAYGYDRNVIKTKIKYVISEIVSRHLSRGSFVCIQSNIKAAVSEVLDGLCNRYYLNVQE